MKMDKTWLVIIGIALLVGCFVTTFAISTIFGFAFKTCLTISVVMYVGVVTVAVGTIAKDLFNYYFGY